MSDKKTDKNTTATAAAPAKEKAPAGSSIPAQCKALVLAIALEAKEHIASLNDGITKEADKFSMIDFVTADTAEWLDKLVTEIGETQQRGLPLETRLANVNAEITEHWTALPTANGKAAATPEWEAKTATLLTKRRNIESAIKKTKESSAPTPA